MKDVHENILRSIERDEVVKFISDMVAVETVETVSAIEPLITGKMKQIGMEVEVYETKNPNVPGTTQPVMLGYLRGRKEKPLLCYNGHTDVVPVMHPDKWTSSPFSPVIRGDRLYGRGSSDMKGGLGCMIMAAQAVAHAGITLDGTLGVAAVPGEETGGWGTESMVRRSKWDAAVIGEPTQLNICPACNGITTFWIEVLGKSAHASMPEMGINAIDKTSKVLAAFERYKEDLTKRAHPLTGSPAFVSCIIKGGWREVIVADRCRLQITTHLVPGESAQQRYAEVVDILEKIKQQDNDFQYSIIDWKNDPLGMPLQKTGPNRPKLDPTEISQDEPIVQAMLRASKEVLGKPLALGGTRYACDSPYFVNDEHIPTIAFGPGNIEQAHTYDEWIGIEELIKATMLYAVGAVEYLGYAE